jgi:hypothetical protein
MLLRDARSEGRIADQEYRNAQRASMVCLSVVKYGACEA